MALAMLRLIGIVISIGLADSLNPTTLAPALYMAAGRAPAPHSRAVHGRRVRRLPAWAAPLIALGPGELVLALVPKPDQTTRQILEVVAGAVLLAVGALLWRHRGRSARSSCPT